MNSPGRSASPSRCLDATGRTIQRQAAEWLARRQARELTLTEQADFAEWIAGDPRHAALFSEVESAWRRFDRLASYPHSLDVSPDPDLLASAPGGSRRRVLRFPLILAAAAAIVMAGILWFRPVPAPEAVAPSTAVAQADPRFRRLPDGSAIELNAGSVVTEHFTATQRRVRLVRGEAHFSVAKDPAREFIVEADGVAVRAIGTAFNVRLDGKSVEILVTEGTVQVAPPVVPTRAIAVQQSAAALPGPRGPTTLTAGQRTVVPAAATANATAIVVETLAAADIDRALSWQTSRLSFDATPLSEVVTRFNRYSAGQKGAPHLTVRDAQLGALRISGRIRSDDIESFVEALESSFGVVADRRADGEIVLRRSDRR